MAIECWLYKTESLTLHWKKKTSIQPEQLISSGNVPWWICREMMLNFYLATDLGQRLGLNNNSIFIVKIFDDTAKQNIKASALST